MSEDDDGAIARAIVDSNRFMTIATADATGRPWASPVGQGQAVYISAVAAELTGADLERGSQIFLRRSVEHVSPSALDFKRT